ncbi:MAG TPA: prolipoprotein diacylglyceryl transferase [Spirochaetota bacterium]|nr:prolipoprotein diacylglyceryl transferase [Spirochaetota bacterium]HQP49116.1 prolipoprotein diacylglyceryl transferase [Spirochaetota bacterium]
MKPFIQIFDVISIPSYNLLAGLGIVAGMLFYERDARRHVKDITEYYLPLVITIIISFGGAVLLQWYLEGGMNREHAGFGMTFYGGLITGAAVFSIICRVIGKDVLYSLNLFTPSLAIAHAIGRIGCFLAGCCYGVPSGVMPGVLFPVGSLPWKHYGPVPLHPVQLYEAGGLFLLFLMLAISGKCFRYRFSFYIAAYGTLRFALEFLRGDDRGILLSSIPLSPAQLISIGFIVVGILLFFITLKMDTAIRELRLKSV